MLFVVAQAAQVPVGQRVMALAIVAAAFAVVVFLLRYLFRPRHPMLCTRCLEQGPPRTAVSGSTAVELALWLFFCVPGLIYSLWRVGSKADVCASCGSPELVPINSPRAAQILGGGRPTP